MAAFQVLEGPGFRRPSKRIPYCEDLGSDGDWSTYWGRGQSNGEPYPGVRFREDEHNNGY